LDFIAVMTNQTPNEPAASQRTLGPTLLLAGLTAVWLASRIGHPGLGDNHDPGPAAFPFALGLCLVLGGIWESVQWLLSRRSSRAGSVPENDSPVHAIAGGESRPWQPDSLILIAAMLVYVVVLPWLGFIPSTLIFAAGMMWRLGAGWKWSLPMAVVLVAGIHLLFVQAFKVQLPAGVWAWPW
jgi:hypothetical protein